MKVTRLPAVLAACLLAACLSYAPVTTRAVAAPCEFDNVERIVAVGDVHGAYDQLLKILEIAGVVDAQGRWAGGRTHFVQTGDVFDRGPDSLKATEFLRKLTREAERAGGRVHALLGNHETMRLLGIYRDAVPAEFEAFRTAGSADLRERLASQVDPATRAKIMAEPLGTIEMVEAFRPQGSLGSYLRTLNTTVRINGIVFVHGGLTPELAKMTCAQINDAVRREMGRDFEKTQRALEKSLSAGEFGPLWYRGLALESEAFQPQVDAILAAQNARAIVVGHSIVPGKITSRFGGKVYTIDTGMQPAYVRDGAASALEIKGPTITAIYLDRREVLAGGVAQEVIR